MSGSDIIVIIKDRSIYFKNYSLFIIDILSLHYEDCMKANQLKTIGEYFTWLIKQIQLLKKENIRLYDYKVVNKELCKKTNKEILVIQVTGKNVLFKMSPKEIVEDDLLLQGFSPLDVRTITYFSCKEFFKENCQDDANPNRLYRINAFTFYHKLKKQMLVIEKLKTEVYITTTLQNISSNFEMIEGFSPKDAYSIGYAAGMEAIIEEKRKKKN
jgi:hypothetical protein